MQALASASTLCLTISASSNYLLRVATFSFKTLTLSLTIASSFFFVSTISLAFYYESTSGLTSLKILLNVTILTVQPQSLAAAKFYPIMNFSLKFLLGSSTTVLTGPKAAGSIFSPLKS